MSSTTFENSTAGQSGIQQKNSIRAPKRKSLECPGCAKAYCTVVSLQYHIKRAHPEVRDELHNIVKAGQWKCTQFQCVMSAEGCMEVCKSRNELLRHLESVHDVGVDWVEQIFASLQDFDEYRVGLRGKGHFFIKATSRRKGRTAAEEPFILFRCNREGSKVDRKGTKDFQQSSKNSIKIGTFCTAYLKVFFRKDDTIRCAGSLTHCNHSINYRVREVEGNISGRVKIIYDDEEEEEMDEDDGEEKTTADGEVELEEEDVSASESVIITENVQLQDEQSMMEAFTEKSVQQEMHIVHVNDDATASGGETQELEDECYEVDQEEYKEIGLLFTYQEDSSAHHSFNTLVEETIWKLQKIQEERTGQRLIFYADALHQLVRSAHESISKTIMEHLQKNKTKRTTFTTNQKPQLQS